MPPTPIHIDNSAPLILCLETSGQVCSVALCRGDHLLASLVLDRANSHADVLSKMIRDVLEYGQHTLAEVKAVAISNGPGSYTGLRIGMAQAKGLCFGANLPLLQIPTHSVMAMAAHPWLRSGDVVVTVQDARRQEVYLSAYQLFDNELTQIVPTQNVVMFTDEWQTITATLATQLNTRTPGFWWVGNGAGKCMAALEEASNALLPSSILREQSQPLATNMASLAFAAYKAKQFSPLAPATPFYLKPWVGNQTQQKKPQPPLESNNS